MCEQQKLYYEEFASELDKIVKLLCQLHIKFIHLSHSSQFKKNPNTSDIHLNDTWYIWK